MPASQRRETWEGAATARLGCCAALWACALAAGCSGRPAQVEAPRAAEQPVPQRIQALGRLEPRGGIVNVGGTTGDRVAKLEVQAGDEVRAGHVLAVLDSFTVRDAQRQAAAVQLDDARRRLDTELDYAKRAQQDAQLAREQALLGKTDVEASEAQLRALTASRDQAVRDLERLEKSDPEVVSQQAIEHQRMMLKRANEELAAAQSQHAKVRASVELAIRAADSKVATAESALARVDAAAAIPSLEAALALAEAQLAASQIKAPVSGRVLKILTHPGETLGQQPILQLADTSQMVAIAEVDETEIRWVKVGQCAEIRSRAFPSDVERLTGRVVWIGHTVAKNSLLMLDPTQVRSDARVVEVHVALDSPAVADRLINLQVDVAILVAEPAPGAKAEISVWEPRPAAPR
ncbi:MAG: efflux RND transporter periplasmic adaptor subunit [Pirellulales bacterium]|nr:efflux RND transporter periplasmic adaptor subunit [Pirellulales bacterium]